MKILESIQSKKAVVGAPKYLIRLGKCTLYLRLFCKIKGLLKNPELCKGEEGKSFIAISFFPTVIFLVKTKYLLNKKQNVEFFMISKT